MKLNKRKTESTLFLLNSNCPNMNLIRNTSAYRHSLLLYLGSKSEEMDKEEGDSKKAKM